MVFQINRMEAKAACEQAFKTCNPKDKQSLDSYIVFNIKNGNARIKTINGVAEQEVVFKIDQQDKEEGSFAISGQVLIDFLRSFKSQDIVCDVRLKKNIVNFTSTDKERKFARPITDATSYTPMNFVPSGSSFECDGQTLANALKATYFAVSDDPTDGAMTAVNLQVKPTGVTAQATDQNRINQYFHECSFDDDTMGNYNFLLPPEIASTLSDLLSDVSEVTIEPGDHHLRFKWDGTVFTSNVVEDSGKAFPDLSKFTDATPTAKVKISRGDFLDALKFAGLTVKDSCVGISIGDSGLSVVASDTEIGASSETLKCEELEGESEALYSWKLLNKSVEGTVSPYIYIHLCEIKNGISLLQVIDNEYISVLIPVVMKSDAQEEDDEDSETDEE